MKAEWLLCYKRLMQTVKLNEDGIRLEASELQDGLLRINVSNRLSRLQRFDVSCYLLGGVLIDSAFSKAGRLLDSFLRNREVRAIVCTHNHEDHTGCAGLIAKRHGCPVYLSQADLAWSEGVGGMPFYRRLWWGRPTPYSPREMPPVIRGEAAELRVIETPGHSRTHVALWEQQRKLLFAGDLYITPGVTAVMTQENPYQSVKSLRRAAKLEAAWLYNGHGLMIEDPSEALLEKADRIEQAANLVLRLNEKGLGHRAILRRLFEGGRKRDWLNYLVTRGEFSRLNFVKACIAQQSTGSDN